MDAIITAMTSVLIGVIGWIGDVVSALFTAEGALYPMLVLFLLGIVVSIVFVGVKAIRSLVWGA